MNKRRLLLALLAVIMVLSVSIGPALAYFSTYTVAEGKKPIKVVPDTTITESVANETQKVLHVTNDGNAPCFVRVKAFAPEDISLSLKSGENWTGGTYDSASQCWVFTYNVVLMTTKPDNETTDLTIEIDLSGLAAGVDDFNIAVVYESTTAIWHNGAYVADDWNWAQDVFPVTLEGGTGA